MLWPEPVSQMLIIYLRGKAQVRQDSLANGMWAGKIGHARETISVCDSTLLRRRVGTDFTNLTITHYTMQQARTQDNI